MMKDMRLKRTLPIGEFRMNSQSAVSPCLSVRQNNELYSRLSAAGIPVRTALVGEAWDIDDAKLEILWPSKEAADDF